MKPEVSIDHLSIKFRLYHDRTPSLKSYFSELLKHGGQGKFTDFWALDDVSLNIKPGERVGIIGNNGAGKSTLLKAICRIYEPTHGVINTIGRIAPLIEIGAGFHPEFTGRENIYLNGAIIGYSKKELQELAPSIIEFAELQEFIDTPVKYYSTGMYMRLAFSLATAIRPDILILDEIFAGGDAGFVKKAKARMTKLIENTEIVLLVSHDHKLLKELCTRVIWVEQGKVIDDGDPIALINKYLGMKDAKKELACAG